MTQTLLNLVADLELSLASAASVGATTATLSSATDGDGVALPNGKYGFTIDPENSAKEFIICDLVGTALTNVQTVSKQGAVTSGFANYHRSGAVVTITDWAILDRMLKNLNGTTGFNSGTPLKYDGQPTLSDPTAIPTVQYVLDTVTGGTVAFDRQIITGDAGETIVAGDWVYFDTADGEWYKTDADIAAKCLNVRIGKAIGAGTNGNPIAGGIFVSGTETVGTYVAGTTYYLSNTAGELSTSAGTNSVVVGVGDANGDLQLRQITPNQVDAAQGGSTFGTPSNANKFVTEQFLSAAVDVQEFDATGTWTKPTRGTYAVIDVIGGGGSGGAAKATTDNAVASGGGGGAYRQFIVKLSNLAATETVTIGAGGAARTTDVANTSITGLTGGVSWFKNTLLQANGGVGGNAQRSSSVLSASGVAGGAITALLISEAGASSGTVTSTPIDAPAGVASIYSGPSGGGSVSNSTPATATGAAASALFTPATSGAGAATQGTGGATAGSGVRGGGGGGAAVRNASGTVTSGAGGNGYVRVTVF